MLLTVRLKGMMQLDLIPDNEYIVTRSIVSVMLPARLNSLSVARQKKRYEIGEAAGEIFWSAPGPIYTIPLERLTLAATL